jgi:hypothetical protein
MTFIEIDGVVVPPLLYTATEMSRSLKIGIEYLRKLEKQGLPYYDIGNENNPNLHRYDPIEVWKWFCENIKHSGGSK